MRIIFARVAPARQRHSTVCPEVEEVDMVARRKRRRSVFSSRKWNENRIDVRRGDGHSVARDDGSATTIQVDIKWLGNPCLIGEKEANESIGSLQK